MNYQKIYTAFIADRRTTEDAAVLLSYTEKHHIVPSSLGGDDTPGNLIRLTPEDHFFAHLLLAKIHGGKLWLAVVLMTASHSRCYGESRRLHGFAAREAQRNKAPDEETKARMLATQQRKAPRFRFACIATGEIFEGTTLEIQRHAGISQGAASKIGTKRAKTASGWCLEENLGAPIGKIDPTPRRFVHKDGRVFSGLMFDFRQAFNLDAGLVSRMVRQGGTCRGWKHAA